MSAQSLKFVFGYKLTETSNPFYGHLLRWNNGSLMRKYFGADVRASLGDYNPVDEFEKQLPSGYYGWDSLSQSQWVESKLLMSNYLLSSQGDRMGMANSIEGRYPFLDYRVIEYCAKLPPSFKLKGLDEKYLLKQMMKNRLPLSVLKRSKQAYRAPIISAFFSKKAPGYVQEFLSEEKIKTSGIFDASLVQGLKKKFETPNIYSESDTMAVTAILSTQLIHSMFIENKYKPKDYQVLLTPRIVTSL
jgi:asparagine synthase (glutamine-hydrolysing)